MQHVDHAEARGTPRGTFAVVEQLDVAALLHQEGKLNEAAQAYMAVLAQDPGHLQALHNLGIALLELDRAQEALACYERALALEPDFAEAHNNRGNALQALGRHAEAVACYDRAIALKPDFGDAYSNLGNTLAALSRREEALQCYQKALLFNPRSAELCRTIARSLMALGRPGEAVACYRKALALEPGFAAAHNDLGIALEALNRNDEAIGCYERAVALAPGLAEAHNNLGNALKALDRDEAAVACYDKAIVLKPDFAHAYSNLGLALGTLGRGDEARRALEKAIELEPAQAAFYLNLVDWKRFSVADPLLAAMAALAKRSHSLAIDDQIKLHFALGKALSDAHQYDRSFAHFCQGNALKRRHTAYNEAAALGMLDRVRAAFTAERMQALKGFGRRSPRPVFIIGMPRSGSTLVEQILAGHPQVFGAGEVDDFKQAMEPLCAPSGGWSYPEAIARATRDDIGAIGTRYLGSIGRLSKDAERVTDKMLANFYCVGLIHLALPDARIIHTRRDPVDTCLSCFSRLFVLDHPYSYDLGELGRFYRAYEALMRHWREVLPAEVMLDVQYEDVVADLEGETRRILAHLGLAWNDACLAFDRSQRPVRTMSAAQVRRPLYQSAVGRWRIHGDRLQPLLDALGSGRAANGG